MDGGLLVVLAKGLCRMSKLGSLGVGLSDIVHVVACLAVVLDTESVDEPVMDYATLGMKCKLEGNGGRLAGWRDDNRPKMKIETTKEKCSRYRMWNTVKRILVMESAMCDVLSWVLDMAALRNTGKAVISSAI